MQEYLDKIAELKDDTKGINSLRETTKLFVEFLEKPEEVAQFRALGWEGIMNKAKSYNPNAEKTSKKKGCKK